MRTSYFANLSKVIAAGLEPVAISSGMPKGFTGRKEKRLAPGWKMLKQPREVYDVQYAELLAALDPMEIYDTLGENACLLCWEAPGLGCHRRIVAEWLEQALGIEIPELGLPRSETPAYALSAWK